MKMIKEIGSSHAYFSRTGKMLGAEFWPGITALAHPSLLHGFSSLALKNPLPIRIRRAGEALIINFFSNATNMEIADPDKYFIDSEIANLDKYRNGKIKSCVVKYFLRSR